MRRIFLFLCLLAHGCSFHSNGSKGEKVAIQKTFDGYREAVLDKDGERVLGYIDESSLKHFGYLLQVLKHSDTATLRILGPMEKLTVLTMRQLLDKETAMNFDVNDLIKRCAEEGLLESSVIANATLLEIDVEQTRAYAQLKLTEDSKEVRTTFVKEADLWKISYNSRMTHLNEQLRLSAAIRGQEEDDYFISVIESISGKKVDESIWIPFEKRK